MAGINEQLTRHANRALITFNGIELGEALSVSVQEDSGAQGLYHIGSTYAKEHYHSQVRVNVSINRVVWDTDVLTELGLLEHELIKLPTFDLTAVEGPDGAPTELFSVVKCTLTGRSITVTANQPISNNVTAMGIQVSTSDIGQVSQATPPAA
jgi:hypothetical protein